jgi:hypothetical protein
MHCVALLWAGLLIGDVSDYSRPLGAKKLDQATLDAEGYGEKKSFKREDDGLSISLKPGEVETGWKTPQALKIGGDFTIAANLVVRKLPKPAQEDGAAIGMAVATQSLDQPDATLIRVIEMDGSDVYRHIDQPKNAPQSPQTMMVNQMGQPGGKPAKPPRQASPAKGEAIRFELKREGQTLFYQVFDGESDRIRYLGQVPVGNGDIAGVKLFVANRNGAEAIDVLFRDLTVRAARITGLGTEVRTVFGEVFRGDPTSIEDGKLIVGGTPKAPPAAPAGGAEKKEAEKKEPEKKEPEKKEPEKKEPEKKEATPKDSAPKDAAPPKPAAATSPAPAPAAAEPAKATDTAKPKADGPAPEKAASGANASGGTAPPAATPKARVPLGEVEGIAYERASTLSGRFLGQPNLDFTMPRGDKDKDEGGAAKPDAKADDVLAPPPGTAPAAAKVPKVEPKPNGVRDLHLALANLRDSAVKQVTINCQTDKGPTAWRLDTADSRDWPLVLRRAGTESWADLFLEPPAGDAHQKDFTVNVTYADGQSTNVTIKATEHTDPKLAYDTEAPAPSVDARVFLAGEEQLFGKIDGLGEDTLRLKTPWGDRLDVPLAHVIGIYMGLPEHKETPESFAKRLKARGTEDLLLARSKDGEVVAIAGVLEGTEGDKLLFHFQDKTRTLPLKQVEGMVLASRPEPKRPDGVRPTFSLAGGIVVSGLWKDLDTATWKVETAWGQELKLPAAEIRTVRFRGGEMSYLSDLEPSRVEETPFFGRRSPWRRDVNLVGEPLKIDGRSFEHGLAVHSRSVLTYDLDGRYATFEALVGFDEAAKGKGRVDCRVLADGKEIYANPDLRGDTPPVRLALPVAKVGQLQLVVDFGPDQDTGDRVIWANARLYRKPPPAPEASADAPRPKASEPNSSPGSGR